MNDLETKQAILASLKAFAAKPLAPAAIALFESLGYRSTKRFALTPNTPANFLTTFEQARKLHHDQALLPEWQTVDCLFQLTDDEVRSAAGGNQQFLFDSRGTWDGAAMESYLFFAITLTKPHYTRTDLSSITRAVNRLFDMPAMLLFRHGDTLTLAVINRRLHKRDEGRDVLTKVTLIKDIRIANPHRAHVEILHDLSFDALQEQHHPSNFKRLHDAWQKTLDISELNKRFYQEVADWYFWALDNVHFPKDAPKDVDGRDAISPYPAPYPAHLLLVHQGKGPHPRHHFQRARARRPDQRFRPPRQRQHGLRLLQGHPPEPLLRHAQHGDGPARGPGHPPFQPPDPRRPHDPHRLAARAPPGGQGQIPNPFQRHPLPQWWPL